MNIVGLWSSNWVENNPGFFFFFLITTLYLQMAATHHLIFLATRSPSIVLFLIAFLFVNKQDYIKEINIAVLFLNSLYRI